MPPTTASILKNELSAYGVPWGNVKLLDAAPSPDTVNYLDLMPNGRVADSPCVFPDAVAESQERPLLYVVDDARLAGDVGSKQREFQIRDLMRVLGSRGDRSYLAVIKPGQLSVIPVSLSLASTVGVPYNADSADAVTLFSRLGLALAKFSGEPEQPDYLFDEMFRLIKHVADQLALQGIAGPDVISLVGRAIFFRFLCDRQIVTNDYVSKIAANAAGLTFCFSTAENAAATCNWLDQTFNGDFLPLHGGKYLPFFKALENKPQGNAFLSLSAILRGDEPAGISYQTTLNWGDFKFAHVPVGLLSQVYEAFSRQWDPHAKSTSVHCTPRRIANYVVEEAFSGLAGAERARVLDPACGAGIFLVLAFRRIYRARWKSTGVRPETNEIRQILENQIAGFDVSESALRLAALSLYLTAIELDPHPLPPSKLRFKALRDRVLFNWRKKSDPEDGPVIGSLGEHVGSKHHEAYQVVLGNPPWTSLPGGNDNDKKESKRLKELAAEFTRLSCDVLRRRGLSELAKAYKNPDRVPDLPFVWRSLEWCQPKGRIAFVLPGRILFKQNTKRNQIPGHSRKVLFQALAVTGIINGSNLSDTDVWPGMSQPFMLLFAQNRQPDENHSVRWVTPHCDVDLNGRGEIRIDSKSVETVAIDATSGEHWLWKALSIGTALDLAIIRKVKAAKGLPIQELWEDELGLVSGNGYKIEEGQPPSSANHLVALPNLDSTTLFRFLVSPAKLKPFTRKTVARPRSRELYRSPMVLMKESPGFDRTKGFALLCFDDIAFNQSFYGYSAFGNENGPELAKYLHLFIHSSLWLHYALLTSPKLGVERRTIYKSDLDDCPIIPWGDLGRDVRKTALGLSQRLLTEDATVFEEIDAFFVELYGLTKRDAEVIRDTLAVAMPFGPVRKAACRRPTPKQQHVFRARVESALTPFFRKLRKECHALPWKGAPDSSPYSVFLLGTTNKPLNFRETMFRDKILPLADQAGTSRIIFEADAGLVIAVLNQWRYWTPSRARLCATEVLRNHMAIFEE